MVLVFAVLILSAWYFSPEEKAARFAKNSASSFCELIENAQPLPSNFNGAKVDVWNEKHAMYQFTLGYGIGDTQYFGVYYSPDNVPLPFQNADIPLVSHDKKGWVWRSEGDNYGATNKITDKWYYFEASF